MKNIHILPTDKPSRLWKNNLLQGKLELSKNVLPFNTSQHIYITSDEIIKKGDWCIEFTPNNEKITELFKCNEEQVLNISTGTDYKYKKVILTTHPDLIKDGVQEIDDEFLEWFVKNPSCEKVDVKYNYVCSNCNEDKNNPKYKTCHGNYRTHILFKIIIPKEEKKQVISVRLENSLKQFNLTLEEALNIEQSKLKQIGFGTRSIIELQNLKPKQETLEEAAERIFDGFGDITKPIVIKRAIELVKCQQERMYSEEEVLKIIDLLFHKYASSFRVDAKEDFLLSKKK